MDEVVTLDAQFNQIARAGTPSVTSENQMMVVREVAGIFAARSTMIPVARVHLGTHHLVFPLPLRPSAAAVPCGRPWPFHSTRDVEVPYGA